jgi:hypothetical protein
LRRDWLFKELFNKFIGFVGGVDIHSIASKKTMIANTTSNLQNKCISVQVFARFI